MRVMAFRCHTTEVDFALVEGSSLEDAALGEHRKLKFPANASRPEELVWLRKEVMSLIANQAPDAVALVPTPPRAQKVSTARAEADGVILEASASAGTPADKVHNATVRAAFKAKNNAELRRTQASVPAMEGVAVSRREVVEAALAVLA